MKQFAAGIVLYNPDLDRLKANISAISTQVKFVYCYNNGISNLENIKKILGNYSNVILIGDGKNLGVATALNKIIKRADKDNIDWILTLDQDSVVCENMIVTMSKHIEENEVLIICPQIEDVRRKNEKKIIKSEKINDIDFCITSGSFMNIKKTLEIGGFDDKLFIGLVDNEICYRIRKNGYRILCDNSIVLNHQLGNLIPSKYEKQLLKLGKLIHSKTFQKLSYKREVNKFRLYYATRNMIYLRKKYSNDYVEVWSIKSLIKNSISSLIRGKCKIQLLNSIIKGIKDGRRINE